MGANPERQGGMLLRNLDLLFTAPDLFLRAVGFFLATGGVALLVGITVHEFSHAWLADRMGDATPRRLGRLTLNPLAHLDPLGTLMLVLVGFGWGRPVPVNPWNLGRDPLKGHALIALAGPASNLLTALLLGLVVRAGAVPWRSPFFLFRSPFASPEEYLAVLVGFLVFYSLVLAVFNLIPLFPLDGSRVLMGLLPRDLALSYAQLERMGPGLLFLLIALDWFTGLNLLERLLFGAGDLLTRLLVGRPLL